MEENIKQLLARSRTVLKGASLELQLRNPYARKLAQVNNMLHWLDSSETSLSYCEREYQNVAKYVLNATHKSVQSIEYRSCTEGIEHPTFFIVNKSNYANELEAFITLHSHQLEHGEEWFLKDINPDNIAMHLDNTLYPYLREFEYKLLDEKDVLADTAWHTKQALKQILNPRKALDSNHCHSGVYENGQKRSVNNDYKFPVEGLFVKGISLRADWNDVAFFYETAQEYVLFVWWTGA